MAIDRHVAVALRRVLIACCAPAASSARRGRSRSTLARPRLGAGPPQRPWRLVRLRRRRRVGDAGGAGHRGPGRRSRYRRGRSGRRRAVVVCGARDSRGARAGGGIEPALGTTWPRRVSPESRARVRGRRRAGSWTSCRWRRRAQGHALLIDCRSLEHPRRSNSRSRAIVVFDSGVRRELATSAYNERRAACERVVAALRTRTPGCGRCVTLDDADAGRAGGVAGRRSMCGAPSHVVAENRRPAALADASRPAISPRPARLMMHSHASLRDLYEVSTPELDTFVDLAIEQPGCTGARLTGAGFGGWRSPW